MIGFDYARAFNPSTALGTANGIVNIGGFLATLIVVQVVGIVLERLGGYTFDRSGGRRRKLADSNRSMFEEDQQ